jgi:hypothetical protein
MKRVAATALLLAIGSLTASTAGECASAAINLVPQKLSTIQTEGMPASQVQMLAKMPPNFYHFGVAHAGQLTKPQALTLRFTTDATITRISTTRDFKLVPGGSCEVGRHYRTAGVCRLLVQFTPKGAGPRLGKVTVENSSGKNVQIGALGYSYFPVVSFTPSIITTVPASESGGSGIIVGAHNLAIDNGDNLIVGDTGNNVVRLMDSSGTFKTLASGYTNIWGVTEDTFGQIYFTRGSSNTINEIYDYGPVVQLNGAGTGACPASAPCTLSSHTVTNPSELSMDPYNHMFFVESTEGAALSTVQPIPANLIFLYDPFPFQTNPPNAMAVDAGDNLYSLWSNGGVCEITQQSLYNAENALVSFNKIAGGHTCGFSGDGGQANGAEIGATIGQIAFDIAGNLYFSDTANNRVRRVDAATGIIRTIAGSGANAYSGDGGPATAAGLGTPTGLGVDSQGQVYTLSPASGGTTQVVRQVTVTGELAFGSVQQGSSSTGMLLNVANTGNSTLTISQETIGGKDPGDFTIYAPYTNCNFNGDLPAGQSCQIDMLFKPSAVGSRTAALFLTDNTINVLNHVTLTGTGTSAATVKFKSPKVTEKLVSGTDVAVTVKVTSKTGPEPTGKVKFYLDDSLVGSSRIASGSASTTAGPLAAGRHALQAVYGGDDYHSKAKAQENIRVSQ